VQKLGKAVHAAVNDPKVNEKLLQLGLVPAGSSPESFATFVQDESARVSALVKARNIQVD
jgi:tripartite-type tricarboxylate transporter receptor subunit TctC